MTSPTLTTALAVLEAPKATDGDAPEWLRLLPVGQSMATDGRGPFFYDDADAVISTSLTSGEPIFIDVDHSSIKPDVADRRAYGYIIELTEREDGIWGKVDWTTAGRALMADRAFWGVSPILRHTKAGKVTRIASVALTNNPALRQLSALTTQAEYGMEFLQKLAVALGLSDTASEEDVMAAIMKMKDAPSDGEAAMTALTDLRGALDLGDDASATELVATAKALKAGADGTTETVVALTAQVKALEEGNKKRDAEAFVDGAIADKRPVAADRETWVALHMENPERAESLVAKLPQLGETGLTAAPPQAGEGVSALTATEIANLAVAHQTKQAADGVVITTAMAVQAVMEGKT
ncbi:phage protease [uncultured Tateyamaria sp.]|uniref:phage protease n=1 Tax=uncultured Tateyamaria sp. TaxID=455651 RepID=UPI00260E5030|nr:phage protease [uncultured Tateyamaria sp.]